MNESFLALLPLALILLIAWLVMHSIRRSGQKVAPFVAEPGQQAGVEGWLLFLVLGLMFLGPLLGAGRLNSGFLDAEGQYAVLKTMTKWSTYKTATWLVFFLQCCGSFYAGYGLLKRRDQSVVKRAIVLMWLCGPAANLFVGGALPLLVFGNSAFSPEFIGAFIASLVTTGIWTMYLKKSKRVMRTYGTGLASPIPNASQP